MDNYTIWQILHDHLEMKDEIGCWSPSRKFPERIDETMKRIRQNGT
jgi:hypothetical protein